MDKSYLPPRIVICFIKLIVLFHALSLSDRKYVLKPLRFRKYDPKFILIFRYSYEIFNCRLEKPVRISIIALDDLKLELQLFDESVGKEEFCKDFKI